MSPTDKPDDKIIADDAAMDSWYENFAREQARKAAKSNGASYGGSPVSIPQYQGGR
jgi:hypothetical protein